MEFDGFNNPPSMYNEIVKVYHDGKRDEALARVEQLLASPDSLTQFELGMLMQMRKAWIAVANPNYSPPAYWEMAAFAPLATRARNAFNDGDYDKCLRDSWHYMQYCPAGSVSFNG